MNAIAVKRHARGRQEVSVWRPCEPGHEPRHPRAAQRHLWQLPELARGMLSAVHLHLLCLAALAQDVVVLVSSVFQQPHQSLLQRVLLKMFVQLAQTDGQVRSTRSTVAAVAVPVFDEHALHFRAGSTAGRRASVLALLFCTGQSTLFAAHLPSWPLGALSIHL